MLRKLYGGNGGILPPTDPRILDMTPEMIDLEFERLAMDSEEKEENKNKFTDDSYDDYDDESDSVDKRLSDPLPETIRDSPFTEDAPLMVRETVTNEDDWDDVEIDDIEYQ